MARCSTWRWSIKRHGLLKKFRIFVCVRRLLILPFLLCCGLLQAQTLGGNSVFNFLKLPYAPAATAAGGIVVAQPAADVSGAFNNPALLQPQHNKQVAFNFLQLPAGIKALNAAGAVYNAALQTRFGAAVTYFNYGRITAADAAGNEGGSFAAADYAIAFSAARTYLQKWNYGITIKTIFSSYGVYKASGVAADVGVQYADSARGFWAGFVAKNMGTQITTYAGAAEELPFDVQFGITQKLSKAPFAFSLSVQQAHRFNLLFDDNSPGGGNPRFSAKAFQHIVLAADVFLSKQLTLTFGYNQLRRADLSFGLPGAGLSGFSGGFAARFEKLSFSYARSTYQRGIGYNQFGISVKLDKLAGAGIF